MGGGDGPGGGDGFGDGGGLGSGGGDGGFGTPLIKFTPPWPASLPTHHFRRGHVEPGA